MIDDWIWIRYSITHFRRNAIEKYLFFWYNEKWKLIQWSECFEQFKYDWLIDNDWDADALEYYIMFNSHVTPSERSLSLHPPAFWISRIDQMKEISTSVESIVIQGGVGKEEKSFSLSDFPSLIILEMGCGAFEKCHSIVFESMNDKINDEWDLIQLQSITIGEVALYGDLNTLKSNVLIMKSMNDNDIDWSDLPSLTLFKGNGYSFVNISKVILESDDWWLYLN